MLQIVFVFHFVNAKPANKSCVVQRITADEWCMVKWDECASEKCNAIVLIICQKKSGQKLNKSNLKSRFYREIIINVCFCDANILRFKSRAIFRFFFFWNGSCLALASLEFWYFYFVVKKRHTKNTGRMFKGTQTKSSTSLSRGQCTFTPSFGRVHNNCGCLFELQELF